MNEQYQILKLEAREQAEQKCRAVDLADKLLTDLGLADLLDLAINVNAPTLDTEYNGTDWLPSDRVHVLIEIDEADKPAARAIIMGGTWTGAWDKGFTVERTYRTEYKLYALREHWRQTFNPKEVAHSIPPVDQLTIVFLSPAQEGQELSDSCKIRSVMPKTQTPNAYLTITCEKPKD